MEFTTHLELHSQATRLEGEVPPTLAPAATGLAPSTGRGLIQVGLGLGARRRGSGPSQTPHATTGGSLRGSVLDSSLFARRYWGNPC